MAAIQSFEAGRVIDYRAHRLCCFRYPAIGAGLVGRIGLHGIVFRDVLG